MTDPALKPYQQQFPDVTAHWRGLPAPAMTLPQYQPRAGGHRWWWVLPVWFLLWLMLPPAPQESGPVRQPVVLVKPPPLRVQVRLPGTAPALPRGRLPPLSAPRPERKPVSGKALRAG